MLKQIDSLTTEENKVFVFADQLVPEDLVGKYILPVMDLLININLDNVQLRDSFEGKVYEQLLPFQKFCIDYYKNTLLKLDINIQFVEGIGYGCGFILFDPVTHKEYYVMHQWKRTDNGLYSLRSVFFDSPIPGTETKALIPTNVWLEAAQKPIGGVILRNTYVKIWKEVEFNPFEFGVFMDRAFYSKTPFHIRNYFANGGKSLNKLIDNDLYR